jgi:protein-arginine kinase activator protein McsA
VTHDHWCPKCVKHYMARWHHEKRDCTWGYSAVCNQCAKAAGWAYDRQHSENQHIVDKALGLIYDKR